MIDHRDGIMANNAFSNLRWATSSENRMNSKHRSDCSSKYTGVYFYKSRGKWCSYSMLNERCKFLGYYDDEKEAAERYNEEAIK